MVENVIDHDLEVSVSDDDVFRTSEEQENT